MNTPLKIAFESAVKGLLCGGLIFSYNAYLGTGNTAGPLFLATAGMAIGNAVYEVGKLAYKHYKNTP